MILPIDTTDRHLPLKRTDCCSLKMMLEFRTLRLKEGYLPFERMNPEHVCTQCRQWEDLTYRNGHHLHHLMREA